MILALRAGLAARLTEMGFPLRVDCARSACSTGAPKRAHRVVLEHDRRAQDVVKLPTGASRNPKRVFDRDVAYQIEVYAFDPSAGALPVEHELELQRNVDGVLEALAYWAQTQRSRLTITGARMLDDQETATATESPVAGYRLGFRLSRAVYRRDYDGTAVEEATVADSTFTTRASGDDGATYEDI